MRGMGILAVAAVAALTATTSVASAQDAARGAQVFKRCMTCHTIEQGGRNKIGPNLFGVFGSTVGGRDNGFRYSSALKNASFTWSEDTLDKWLTSPRDFIPGNRMNFRGLPSAQDRADVIAFLKANR